MFINSSDYLSLITSQHRGKPKYVETVQSFLDKVGDVTVCLANFEFNFNLDTAVGNQLDIIGELVGAKRKLDFVPSGATSNNLNDDDFRFLIKSKISQNTWDGTTEGLNRIWSTMFPESVLVVYDNQDLTCNLLLMTSLSSIQIELLLNDMLLPKPAGVTYNYSFITKTLFSYNKDDSQYGGYNEGYWQGDFKLFAFDMDAEVFKGWDIGEWV